ncbi:MAG: hypothetical protein MPJ78_19185 [Hyphomicrobiaceae bacterium]|nr:hypothetical protein [Hyphomicrobiaceae bacterium]
MHATLKILLRPMEDIMNAATATMQMRSTLQMGAAAAVFMAGLCLQALTASAEGFTAGKSDGLQACVRAVFSTQEVKSVDVHGHRFDCKPLVKGDYGERALHLAHEQVLGLDEQVHVRFTINSLGRLVPGSAQAFISDGLTPEDVFKRDKKEGVDDSSWIGRYVSRSYAVVANKAKRVMPKKTKDWQQAAGQIAALVIAEMAERMPGPVPAGASDCSRPTFYEHENFRGKRFALGMSVAKLSKVTVEDTRMWTRITSLCVPKGWSVSLFEKDDFKGRAQTFTGHAVEADLGRIRRANGFYTDFDNTARSIRVTRDGSVQQTVQTAHTQ